MVSFILLCLFLGLGHVFRSKIKLLQKLYLPSCVIGGIVALLVVQFFALMNNKFGLFAETNSLITEWSQPWSKLPSFLINIVFACLFLGVKLPKFSTLWHRAGPQVAYGQIVAWGQYVVGLGLWIVALSFIWPSLPDMFAGTLPVGFEGGHGTAAGMADVFEHYGWAQGKDFALTSATFGICSAIIVGMILVNWAVRKGYTHKNAEPSAIPEDDSISVIPVEKRPSAGKLTVKSDAIETFSLHIVIIGIAVGIAYLAKQGLVLIEHSVPWIAEHKLLSGFPLFPLCMLAGLLIQVFEEKYDKHKLIDLGITRRIQNSSLDFLVVAAIATIRLNIVAAGIVPLLVLVLAGILWNVFCVVYLARRILPDAWFERSIAEMGQSMGVTATGLLLLRVVDPDYESSAADAFACKQLVHEPFMGGGLWTGIAIPLIAVIGPVKVFFIALTAVIIWFAIIFCSALIRRSKRSV
ncbi:MAG: sodium/glutamate symporter [Phycisphaerales bacterium]|jgi:ESS family glutamate:Na+ symporter